jgi:hypothetical protein
MTLFCFELSNASKIDNFNLISFSTEPSKSSQCSSLSDGESFECFGENDHMTSNIDNSTGTIVVDTGVDLDQAPQIHKYDTLILHSLIE